jgi:hypothetical protein
MLVWFAAQTAPDKPELKAPPERYHPALPRKHSEENAPSGRFLRFMRFIL